MRLQVGSLTLLSGLKKGSGVAVSCGVGRRLCSDPALLWLLCRPAAVALIQPLAWKPPYAVGVALKSKKKKKKNLRRFVSPLTWTTDPIMGWGSIEWK